MNRAELNDFSDRASRQVFGHILPFWSGPALDLQEGGWLGWMSNELKVDRTQPKGLIVNARILWAFSAAYRIKRQEIYRAMAQRALEYLLEKFWDAQLGGAFWRLDSSGKLLDDSKKIYGQAFYIYALTEFFQAFGGSNSGESTAVSRSARLALDRAVQVFELTESHAYDPNNGGYLEVCRRDWVAAADARLSEKDMAEKKSMNNHLHVLEAYTNLFRVWNNSKLHARLVELIGLFETRIIDSRTFHCHHFFDEQWQVRSDTYTFGHDIEASWLLCEAAEIAGQPGVVKRVRQLSREIARRVLNEALDVDGALSYEGKAGAVIDRRKESWPQAEAVVGFLNAYQITGEDPFLKAALQVWNYVEANLVDRSHGEWFWRINLDGRPDLALPKVSEWKGPYHGTRACLESVRRIAQLLQDNHEEKHF
jgi:cellobiose epimerase